MTRDEAYDLIDHRLRAVYDDEAYAELSAALDLCFTDTELADKVREECAQVCEGVVCGSQGMAGPSRCILKPGHDGPHSYGVPMAKTQKECAAAIRAMKERP